MNWNPRFAERTQRTRRTAVREILKLANQPGILSFAGGMPAPELFPVEAIRTVTDRVLRDHGPGVLQYAETEGIPDLRDWIAENASRSGARVKRENVIILNGAQQALDLVGRVFLDPGDLVLVENPTYLAALSAWRPLGARFCGLACDEKGLRTELLPEVLPTDAKAVYTTPTFQNPQGTTMTMDRRLALMDWCGRHGLPLIEDTPYDSLRYEGEILPSLLELELESEPQPSWEEGGCVIQLGTFSKSIAPGLRVGWAIAPQPVIENLVRAKQASDLHTSPFTQRIILELLRNGILEQQLPRLREVYRARRDAMLAALPGAMPEGVSWTRPEGGMFLMLTVPEQLDTAQLLPKALKEGVAFVPGVEFYPDGSVHHTMRLNFTRHKEEEIREGILRLARVIQQSLTASIHVKAVRFPDRLLKP
jgi:2-aminoadipate transaminase